MSWDDGATHLAAFLARYGLTQRDFARVLGCSANSVCQWLARTYRPSPHWRARIEAASDGEVPASAWVTDAERRADAWRAAHPTTGARDGR